MAILFINTYVSTKFFSAREEVRKSIHTQAFYSYVCISCCNVHPTFSKNQEPERENNTNISESLSTFQDEMLDLDGINIC